jgi:hypothetical protein
MLKHENALAINDALVGSGTLHFVRPPEEIYHYTTLDAFTSIIESKTLWATSHRYMNDPNELRLGMSSIISECIEFLGEPDSPLYLECEVLLRRLFDHGPDRDVFVSSFCEKEDLLNQWRLYGRDARAVCLAFTTDVSRGPRIAACIYDETAQRNVAEGLYRSFKNGLEISFQAVSSGEDPTELANYLIAVFTEQLVLASSTLKREGFSEEREWRCLVANGTVGIHPVEYRPSPYGIAPYLKLPIVNQHRPTDIVRPHVLSGVTIGPGAFAEHHARDVSDFLLKHGFDVPVRVSSAQIR